MKMIFINLIVIIFYIMLAILSRKHFSKYKDGKVGNTKILLLAMSETVYEKIEDRVNWDGIKDSIRKIRVVSPKGLNDLTEKYAVRVITVCLIALFAFNLISGFVCIGSGKADGTNIIERADYQGDTKEHDIYLNVDGDMFVYSMGVAPVEYTEEEFYNLTDELFVEIQDEILGANIDTEHISSDLKLPLADKNNTFRINWSSDHPEYISSTGMVYPEELSESVVVILTAEIEYLDYSAEQDYVLVMEDSKRNAENSMIDIVGQSLDNLENENRNKKTIILPSEISGVGISLSQKETNTSVQILALGILVMGILVIVSISRLKEAGRNRDNTLMDSYPSFVNKLWLLLGTGMTIKAGLKQIITESKDRDILIREIEYALNQIDSGFNEWDVYEQLGRRLDLPVYSRLMSHISQNLRMGTRDLLKLMEEEVHTSLGERKEFARRKGEETSTKLLIPMIILLVTVMVIIIFPAIISF